MDHLRDNAAGPRRKFLGRFAVPLNGKNTGRGKFSPPLQYGHPSIIATSSKPTIVAPSVKHDSTFGDSFCNDDILDGLCEIEAQYGVSSRKRQSSMLFSEDSQDQGKRYGKRNGVQGKLSAEIKCNSEERGIESSNTRSNVERCDSSDLQDKENVIEAPVGADTLEAIDALDLDDDEFPDEVTSPGEEKGGQHGLSSRGGCGISDSIFLNITSCMENVSVRRSQRIRVKNETDRGRMVPPANNRSDHEVDQVLGPKKIKKSTTPSRERTKSKDQKEHQIQKNNESYSKKELEERHRKTQSKEENIKNYSTPDRLRTKSKDQKEHQIPKNNESYSKKKLEERQRKTQSKEENIKNYNTPDRQIACLSPQSNPGKQDKKTENTRIDDKKEGYIKVNNKVSTTRKSLQLIDNSEKTSSTITIRNEEHNGKKERNKMDYPMSCNRTEESLEVQHSPQRSNEVKKLSSPVTRRQAAKLNESNFFQSDNKSKDPKPNTLVQSGITGEVAFPSIPHDPAPAIHSIQSKKCDQPDCENPAEFVEVVSPYANEKVMTKEKDVSQLSVDSQVVQATPRPEKALRSPFTDSRSVVSFISTQEKMELTSWGLPEVVLQRYLTSGIQTMFPWQAECLSLPDVLNGKNLVYSAPTSAGKTLVAELLLLKRVIESGRKGVFILPFVSVAREKMYYLQKMFGPAGVRVEGFMGSQGPPGGLRATDIAVCTIEKANNLVNRLLEDKRISELGIIVVDELHMLADSHRGYLLELLLTKIMFVSSCMKMDKQAKGDAGIQIVGMSATLPNLDLLSYWLSSQLYSTDFRPIPLMQMVKINKAVYDSDMHKLRDLDPLLTVKGDSDHLIQLCLETVLTGLSVLVFCPTKAWCEKLAEAVAREFFNIGKADSQYPPEVSSRLRQSLDSEGIARVMQALRKCPVGLDSVLARSISFGAAFHHAGLTFDERDIIEGGFRTGSIRVLIATSTLSSGVNLPARRVIVRSPVFGGKILDTQTYRQMIGRAGRKGVDTEGESILICREGEQQKAKTLMTSSLPPVTSCLQQDSSLTSSMKRAILEVIVSGIATTPEEVERYSKSTLLAASLLKEMTPSQADSQNSILSCVEFLEENEFIRLQDVEGSIRYISTQLGCAVLASGLSPDEGLHVFSELHRARKCFVLENELHIIYQVTPVYVSSAWPNMDWLTFLSIWESLSEDMKRVAELVGVEESFIVRAMKGTVNRKVRRQAKQLAVHQRFYTALALHELVQEVPLNKVARKYAATRGMLQSLQQSAATFAGMVTVFCNRLGWHNMELLIAQFQDRLHFGIQRELCDLVRLTHLNGQRARDLYNAGLETVNLVAHATPQDVENILRSSTPFHSNKMGEEENRKGGTIWLSTGQPLTEAQAAVLIVKEARELVQKELGISSVDWTQRTEALTTPSRNIPLPKARSTSAGRKVLSAKRVNAVSPNLILRSESVQGRDSLTSKIVETGINDAITPLRRSNRKRISPAARNSRRMSKSPRIDTNLKGTRKRLSTELRSEHKDQATGSSEFQVLPGPSGNDNPVDLISKAPDYQLNPDTESASKSMNVDDNLGNSSERKDTDLCINKKSIICEPPKDLQVLESGEKSRKEDLGVSSERRERKDLKGKIKNRQPAEGKAEIVRDEAAEVRKVTEVNMEVENLEHQNKTAEKKSLNEPQKEISIEPGEESFKDKKSCSEKKDLKSTKRDECEDTILQKKDEKKLNVASKVKDAPAEGTKKKSAMAGLLFGKNKSRKKGLEVNIGKGHNESDSFCIPESQEDKIDNVFSPKRRCRADIQKKGDTPKKTERGLEQKQDNKGKNESIDRELPQISPQKDSHNGKVKRKSKDVNTSTPVVERVQSALAVNNATPITDSEAKHNITPIHQQMCGDSLDGIVANLSFNDSQAMEEPAGACRDESDMFGESDVGEISKDADRSANEVSEGKDKKEKAEDETKVKQKLEGNLIGDSIGFLSESQKDNFFRTMDSQDFDFGEPDRRLQDEVFDCDENALDDEIEIQRKEEHFSALYSNDMAKLKKKKPIGSRDHLAPAGIEIVEGREMATEKATLQSETPNSNLMKKVETPMYQACSEELDFAFDMSRSEDRDHTAAKHQIAECHEDLDNNGSYLTTSHKRQSPTKLRRNVETAQDTFDFVDSELPIDGDLDLNICEDPNEDLRENTNKGDDTLSDSFLDRAFESYLHLSSNTDESNDSVPRIDEPVTSNATVEDEMSTNILEKNCLGDTFGELNMTPGTEALIDGLTQGRKNLQTNAQQSNKGRLSDDLFATPTSPPPRRRRSQRASTSQVGKADGKIVKKPNKIEEVGCKEVKMSHAAGSSCHKLDKERIHLTPRDMNEAGPSDAVRAESKSLCIIDVVNDNRLFECFGKEWDEQKIFSVALACEKAPSQQSKGGIGWRVTGQSRTPRRNQRPQEVAGLVIENSNLLIVGIAVCWGGHDAYYINLRSLQEDPVSCSLPTPPLTEAVPLESRIEVIRKVISTGNKADYILRVWDAKNFVRLLASASIGTVCMSTEDPRVASWMIDPGAKEQNIYNLVMNHNLESLPLLEGIGSSWGMASLGVNVNNPGSCRVRAATECVVVYHLMASLRSHLSELEMLQSFDEVEMPNVVILACMEISGMGFSNRECEAQKSVMQTRMASLEKEMYSLVGHPFSLTSPDEVSQVLYCELRLPLPGGASSTMRGRGRGGRGGRGSRTSGPTNKESLEKLAHLHQLPGKILEWRRINSSLTKIVFPLQQERMHCPRMAMDRIHPSCHTFTATGRVTMHEPNLQTVPKDFDIQVVVGQGDGSSKGTRAQQRALANSAIMSQLGPLLESEHADHTVSLRHALVAQKGWVLLAADYSQLELRLLAHLASCERLLKVLNSGEDVFKMIAAQINAVEARDVSDEWRQQAKQICYGMLYGMGARALGEQLDMDENDAQAFMDKFKGRFPGVKNFLQVTVEETRSRGHVLTLMGRRRYLPNISSLNVHARAQSERQAVNTSIQGSAADLVKLAMVRIRDALRQAFPEDPHHHSRGAFLVLQLHDELIYEVASDDVIQVAQLVRSHMEGVRQLSVNLPVKIKVGPSWGSMQTLNL